MKAGLIEKIKSNGYWRVNYRPARPPVEEITLSACRELVEKSRVSMRGWDFPHVSQNRTDRPEGGGYHNVGDHVENWTDWSGFVEFWRMYRSTQFISYVALREDTRKDWHGNQVVPTLDVISTIYSITEFFEFCSRLCGYGLYESGVTVSITLFGSLGRHLQAGVGRFPFLEAHTTMASKVEFKKSIFSTGISDSDYRSFAVDACLYLFDQFGWNPARTQIEADQEKFYQRQF